MATIRVRMTSMKWYEVEGQMVGETIALTPTLNDKLEYTRLWHVTHTPTGAAFVESQSKASAEAIARALVRLGFDGVRETEVNKAVAEMRKRGHIQGFLLDVRGRPPKTVEQIARAYGRALPSSRTVPVKPARVSKPATKVTPKRKAAATRKSKPTKAKAPPDLLALARAARQGAL